MGTVRLAKPADYPSLREWDEFWGDRRQEMQRAELFVYENSSSGVVGYLSISRSAFLHYPFISIVCVKESHRRKGIGTDLLNKVESVLEGSRHFTSTEPGNTGAKSLFKSSGFTFAGELTDVNFDRSAEQFFVKEILS